MNIEEIRKKCLSVMGTEEFIDKVIVNYKIMEKVFAFFPITFKNMSILLSLNVIQ